MLIVSSYFVSSKIHKLTCLPFVSTEDFRKIWKFLISFLQIEIWTNIQKYVYYL